MTSEVEGGERFKNVIWEGRFQPVHLGHVALVRRLLTCGDHVWIWVVANERSEEVVDDVRQLPVPEFTQTVDPHHVSSKNPLPFWLRYRLVVETLQDEIGDQRVTVCGGRRLDLAWDLYAKILPPDRVFVTPTRDEFEDAKAAAWTALGERCVRLDTSDLPKISASLLRERLHDGRSIDDLMSVTTQRILREEGFFDRLTGSSAPDGPRSADV